MQPCRLLVLDLIPANTSRAYLAAHNFFKGKHGRLAGKLKRKFPPGQVSLAALMETKHMLEEAGILCHMEYAGKEYPQCTMFCNSDHHRDHTAQCKQRRRATRA